MADFNTQKSINLGLEQIAKALSTEDYYNRVTELFKAETSASSIETTVNTATANIVREASTIKGTEMGIPGLPAKVAVSETSTWQFPADFNAPDSKITGTSEISGSGVPGQVVADYVFTRISDSETNVSVTGKLTVNVPFFGKKMEQKALPYVDNVLAAQLDLLKESI